jgi:hypothetical protein
MTQGSFRYLVSDGKTTASATVTIKLLPKYPLHNMRNAYDVNNDGYVVAYDALLIINFINAFGATEVHQVGAASLPNLYYDTRPDNFIAASDVLAVINYLNAHPGQSSAASSDGAEGESIGTAASDDFSDSTQFLTSDKQSAASNSQFGSTQFILSTGAPISAGASTIVPSPAALPPDASILDPDAVDQCLEIDGPDSSDDDLRLL